MIRDVSRNWTGTAFGSSKAQTVDLLGDGNKTSFSALPGVTQELESIFRTDTKSSGILNGVVLSDDNFTKTAFYDALKRHRPLVHISSHFSFHPGDDLRSFLLLGDGFLTLNELKKQRNLFRGVELLTLSACNTAATRSDANGREIDGFSELAQRLGTGAVMATLWQVSDASTPWIMRDFYANRQSKKDGMTKIESLQKAQLALLYNTAQIKPLMETAKGASTSPVKLIVIPKGVKRSDNNQTRSDVIYLNENEAPLFQKDGKKPFAHPYYWSSFVLIGNWR
jgi:CHAT domain-containing protein